MFPVSLVNAIEVGAIYYFVVFEICIINMFYMFFIIELIFKTFINFLFRLLNFPFVTLHLYFSALSHNQYCIKVCV